MLDLGLPDLEGTEVCRRIRSTSQVPIVVLSARGAEADKVHALDLGADDYVTKPFGPEELLARIRVALRRARRQRAATGRTFVRGDITIDYARRRVLRAGVEIRLTPKEFELLSLLARNHDRVLTHRTILKAIWGAQRRRAARAPVDAGRPSSARRSSPTPRARKYLLSEPWVGYRFVDRRLLTHRPTSLATGRGSRSAARPGFSPEIRSSGIRQTCLLQALRLMLIPWPAFWSSASPFSGHSRSGRCRSRHRLRCSRRPGDGVRVVSRLERCPTVSAGDASGSQTDAGIVMSDLLFVVLSLAFFALGAAYVAGCRRLA